MRGFLCVLLLVCGLGSSCGPPRRPAPKEGPPTRICSLTLATDELLASLVPKDSVVGVTRFVDDALLSNAAAHYPFGVPRMAANLEEIVALEPDLVCVAAYNLAEFLEILTTSGLRTFKIKSARSFQDVEQSIADLAEEVGAVERGNELLAAFRSRLEAVSKALEGVQARPRVLHWSRGWTNGADTTIGELIERAGGVNVGKTLGLVGSCSVSQERVLAADPECLLLEVEGTDPTEGLPVVFQTLRAVREKRVFVFEPRVLSTLSHHLASGVERLARALHPKAFEGLK